MYWPQGLLLRPSKRLVTSGGWYAGCPANGCPLCFRQKHDPLVNSIISKEAMLPQHACRLWCAAHHALLESCVLLLEPLKGLCQPGSIQPQQEHVTVTEVRTSIGRGGTDCSQLGRLVCTWRSLKCSQPDGMFGTFKKQSSRVSAGPATASGSFLLASYRCELHLD